MLWYPPKSKLVYNDPREEKETQNRFKLFLILQLMYESSACKLTQFKLYSEISINQEFFKSESFHGDLIVYKKNQRYA